MDLPSQISYNLILNPKQGRGPGNSDLELQGFVLLFLRQMPGSLKNHSAPTVEAHSLQEKIILTVNWVDNSGGDLHCILKILQIFIYKKIPHECPLKMC